jgi:hypothetical protein
MRILTDDAWRGRRRQNVGRTAFLNNPPAADPGIRPSFAKPKMEFDVSCGFMSGP